MKFAVAFTMKEIARKNILLPMHLAALQFALKFCSNTDNILYTPTQVLMIWSG